LDTLGTVGQDDDEAWRSIVDNYGERPRLDEQPSAALDPDDDVPETSRPTPDPVDASDWDTGRGAGPDEDEDRFVPPPPPPVPATTADRKAAWFGIFGSPTVLLVTLVLGIRLPAIVNYALVAAFVGGFVYLVLKMNREPRDPYDNGAVL
jgi:hypothetical protein